MKWSWKLGEFAGIKVYMHATFLILIGWVALAHWIRGQSVELMLVGVGFILAIFSCVLLHEFGHALTAKKYGIKTRDITLLPIGGVARLERMPDEPLQELWVALAGPAVNIVIAAGLFVWLNITNTMEPLSQLSITSGSFLERLMLINIFLVAFNMLPAFPMDGGRVLRALLASRMNYSRATQIAAAIGQGMAILFGFVGLFINPFLLFIALFVWIGAAQEASMAQMKSALGGIPVNRAMMTEFHTLSPREPLARAIELILGGSQKDFPVEENGKVVGVLMQSDLFTALAKGGQEMPVSEVMRREFQVADSFDMLETLFRQMQTCTCHTAPVVRAGKLVGIVTMENIGEFIRIQAALSAEKGDGDNWQAFSNVEMAKT